jgi:hypothetical protein
VRFEILTELKITALFFRAVTPCQLISIYQLFEKNALYALRAGTMHRLI